MKVYVVTTTEYSEYSPADHQIRDIYSTFEEASKAMDSYLTLLRSGVLYPSHVDCEIEEFDLKEKFDFQKLKVPEQEK